MQSASFQFMQTAFDTIALVLILTKTYRQTRGARSLSSIRTVIAKHGVLYYTCVSILHYGYVANDLSSIRVVFSLNLSWAVMIIVATVSIHADLNPYFMF